AFHIGMPLLAADALAGSEQAGSAPQDLLIGARALAELESELARLVPQPLAGEHLRIAAQAVPPPRQAGERQQQDRQRHAGLPQHGDRPIEVECSHDGEYGRSTQAGSGWSSTPGTWLSVDLSA